MGLVVFGVMGLYLLISIGVVKGAITYAREQGKSAMRWGWGAALVMYLIPFWDWIPTVAMHQYYCATEAGFWVYKTPEQWKKENPGVMETLVANKGAPSKFEGNKNSFTDTYFLNSRINKILKKTGPISFNVWRWEQQLVDASTGSALAITTDFSTGNGNIGGEPPYRFWLQTSGCSGGIAISSSQFDDIKHQFIGRHQLD